MGVRLHSVEKLKALLSQHGSVREASIASGIGESTFRRNGVKDYPKIEDVIEATPLPPDDIPVEEIISRMERDYSVRAKYTKAEALRTHKLKIKCPFALQWFGDPHMDDSGCNWPMLKRDLAIAKSSEAILPCNLGDALNNWVGGLQKLYAHQNVSETRALKLYEWFLDEVPWYLWLWVITAYGLPRAAV